MKSGFCLAWRHLRYARIPNRWNYYYCMVLHGRQREKEEEKQKKNTCCEHRKLPRIKATINYLIIIALHKYFLKTLSTNGWAQKKTPLITRYKHSFFCIVFFYLYFFLFWTSFFFTNGNGIIKKMKRRHPHHHNNNNKNKERSTNGRRIGSSRFGVDGCWICGVFLLFGQIIAIFDVHWWFALCVWTGLTFFCFRRW